MPFVIINKPLHIKMGHISCVIFVLEPGGRVDMTRSAESAGKVKNGAHLCKIVFV